MMLMVLAIQRNKEFMIFYKVQFIADVKTEKMNIFL